MELAALGLRIDARGAIRTLNKYSSSASNAGRATEKFERTTKNLTATLGALGGFFGIRQLVQYADTWTLISARVGVVTKSHEEMMTVQMRLFEISQKTRNTMAATAVLFTRAALNADQLGRSHEELLTVVESVNAAVLIGGATGVEAAQSMRQFAQALGKGKLDGDELRTVLEAMPLVARAISDELGVTVGALQDLGEKGLITVQVMMEALIKKNKEWLALVDDMPFTFGQAMELLNNSLTQVVGMINAALGASEGFADGIRFLGRNMTKIVASVAAMVVVLTAYRVILLATTAIQSIYLGFRALQGWVELASHIGKAASAMRLLKASAQGIAGILIMIAAASIGMIAYKKILEEITKATEEWINANADLTVPLGDQVDAINKAAVAARNKMGDMIRLANQEVVMAGTAEEAQDRLAIMFDAVNQRIEARRVLQGLLLEGMLIAISREEELLLVALEVEQVMGAQQEALAEQAQLIERFTKNLQRSFADVFAAIFEDGVDKFSDLFDAIKKLFFRLVAEMAAAKVMAQIGQSLSGALSGVFGVSAEQERLNQAAAIASSFSQGHMQGALGGAPLPVDVVGFTIPAGASLASQIAKFLAPAIAGFLIGGIVGGQTTNRALGALGGAASGAAIGGAIGGPAGAVIGAIAGAIGGFLGAAKKQREEAEKLRKQLAFNAQVLRENNESLRQMREAFMGTGNATLQRLSRVISIMAGNDGFGPSNLDTINQVIDLANSLGIQLFDEAGILISGTLAQLNEAVQQSILEITQFGNNLSDARRQQDAFNKLFGIEGTGLQDTFDILNQLAPDLMNALGLTNLNLDTDAGRATARAGLQDIFNMILAGDFTNDPALLGAFENKDQLIDAILRASDALDEMATMIFNITTDFPRAMDIAFFEQKFGTFGTGRQPLDPEDVDIIPSRGRDGIHIEGGVTIVVDRDETGEAILNRIEGAARTRRRRGGSVDLAHPDETLF